MNSAKTETGVCPKCAYERRADDRAPAWQCPSCGIAYHKYASYLARTRAALAAPDASTGVPAPFSDTSVWMLVGSNVLALGVAATQPGGLHYLMLVFWAQSVVIGVSNTLRIWNLEQFSTANFKINNRSVEPTVSTKRQTATFFAFHYGFFHLVYLIFLISMNPEGGFFDIWFIFCTAAFAVNHMFSYRYNRKLDAQGCPNIGTLMFTPYLRIIPMHICIIVGAQTDFGLWGLLLFGTLKTGADVGMHLIEHARLRKAAAQKNLP